MAGPRASGVEIPISWQGRPARAWLPAAIEARDLELGVSAARATERAAAAVRRAADRLPTNWEPLARLLLRAEGVASSNIEGVRAPVAMVAAAELDGAFVDDVATWVADNLDAVQAAISEASAGSLTIEGIHGWHERLMRHGHLPADMIGRFRAAQGWIGGSSPLDAVFVPPPPEHVASLMEDLVFFVNRDDIDSITQAAVAHAQFETIHPYGDGNGRIGRVLVGWVLARREPITVPPPVSVLIARDSGGYLSGLYNFRMGDLNSWVKWFAETVCRAGDATVTLVEHIQTLMTEWADRIADVRADAAAPAVLALLPSHPVLNAAVVAGELAVSERTALTTLSALADRGILEPFDVAPGGPGRPRRWWCARTLLNEVSSWAG